MKNLVKHLPGFLPLVAILVLFTAIQSSQAQVWENLPGHAKAIGAGGDTTDVVWAIGRDDSAFRWDDNSFTWSTAGGKAQMIAVTGAGVPWVVNNRQIYRLRGQVWQSMPGKAVAIGAGGDAVWAIGESGSVFKWNEDAFSWEDFGGNAQRICVTKDGIPWVINNLQIYRLRGRVWQNMPGKAKDIASGGGEIWAIGENNAVFRWNEDAFTWSNVGGNASQIAAGGTGTPYVIAGNGTQVYRLRNWR